jgi:hypothetical protein
MSYTLQQTINWAQTYVQYIPLTAGTGNEPAISIGNTVQSTILNAPFVWPFNRNEFPIVLVTGQQDYVFDVTDFAYLEKVSLLSADGSDGFEVKDVYNTNILGLAATGSTAQPNAVAVKLYTPDTSIALRFLSNPDQAYTGTLTYQVIVDPFTALDDPWAPIPDSFIDIFNNLFLAEVMAVADDAREQLYRQRGIAALLSKAEGLTEMQRNVYLAQYLARGSSMTLAAQLRTQQAIQARGL